MHEGRLTDPPSFSYPSLNPGAMACVFGSAVRELAVTLAGMTPEAPLALVKRLLALCPPPDAPFLGHRHEEAILALGCFVVDSQGMQHAAEVVPYLIRCGRRSALMNDHRRSLHSTLPPPHRTSLLPCASPLPSLYPLAPICPQEDVVHPLSLNPLYFAPKHHDLKYCACVLTHRMCATDARTHEYTHASVQLRATFAPHGAA